MAPPPPVPGGYPSASSLGDTPDPIPSDEHARRLSSVLRYISHLRRDSTAGSCPFVRDGLRASPPRAYFQGEDTDGLPSHVLCSVSDFRR
eukprot:CAMPEP_0194293526 /NCGR_PEP_ID=MMETSP0169-20130528/48130_1 /TAXON_ID=218684 /ORGANISM="Corethron pennatum, Strain L29A3" /LENGTH=89 /DNA_ID=CAMNT_0039042065 /DNA_START=15 /DNA_END=281 /DNA_ORIENTATION=-